MDFQNLIETKLEPIGEVGNDIVYRCPQCEGDQGSGHFYVDYDKGFYHCFKCGLRGRKLESLLRFLMRDSSFCFYVLRNWTLAVNSADHKETKCFICFRSVNRAPTSDFCLRGSLC